MKRSILSVLLCAAIFTCQAQQRKASNFDFTQFPEVSFVWNEYNPNVIEAAQAGLSIEGKSTPLSWTHVENPEIRSRNKSILILWEDMESHGRQSDFTAAMLEAFFDKDISARDRFCILAFNRDRGNGNFMLPVTDGFTDDAYRIQQEIRAYGYSRRTFKVSPYSSNVYQAINEGLSILEKEPSDNIKAIFVVTAGINMQSSGSPKEFSGIEALRRNIPVYVVKYPLNGDRSRKDVDGIETSTYGELIIPDSLKDDAGAADRMYSAYQNIDKRHYGHDYVVRFTAPHKKDGKTHDVTLNIKGVEHKVSYTAPSFSLIGWASDHLILAILICLLLAGAIAVAIWLLIRASKKRKSEASRKEIQQAYMLKQSQKRQDELQQQLERDRKAREEADAAARKAREEALKQDETARMEHLMKVKNIYPRIIYTVDGRQVTYTVKTPETRIGRNGNNDIVLSKATVSREHAIIRFNGAGFEICNLSKTNRTIVNGQFVEQQGLKSGDRIGIGEIIINFYV